MLISITTKTFDLEGSVTIDVANPGFGNARRRANRVATLDGGSVVNDFGYSDTDRTVSLDWIPTSDEDAVLRNMIRYHDRLRVATPVGMFECIVGGYEIRSSGRAVLSLLPVETLAE